MCGIVGIAVFNESPPPSFAQLKQMCGTIIHRGPDDEAVDIKSNVGMGMRRLSIIDLEGGRQPIFNEDYSVRTMFNGEIYNFKELRRQLESNGHFFRTNSDTEVIVHAYEQYGKEFPKFLNGMFAIALHDLKNKMLYLVRDHVGIKPLYYAFKKKYIIWGSEIKALLASGMLKRELNIDALGQFLAWEYIPGKHTLFKGINKLKPGQMIEIHLENPACKPVTYWDVPNRHASFSMTSKYWEEAVDQKLEECVKRQLVSDVPLGGFLSGGVDSSLVMASMGDAKAFSIGFDDSTYNELSHARKVAAYLGIEHVESILRPDILELFERLMYHMDDPIGDFSIFPTYLVSSHTRKHVKVALSGDGGDELFGGYETYIAQYIAEQYARMPIFIRNSFIEPIIKFMRPRPAKKGVVNKAKRFIEGLEHPTMLKHARWRIFGGELFRSEIFTEEAQNSLLTPSGCHILDLFHRSRDRTPLNQCLYVDFKSYLVDNCLVKVDRMSMAASLEVRVPFLDKELVELAFQVPDNLKVTKGQTKVMLKKLAAKYVPRECIYRPKEGFSIPIKHWLNTILRPLMENLLDQRKIHSQGIFKPSKIKQLKQEHLAGLANHSHILWPMMIFQAWHERWLEGPVRIQSVTGTSTHR